MRPELSAAWLGLGAVLTTATQLRVGPSVGPGELMLVLWIVATLPAIANGGHRAVSPAGRTFIGFWAVSLLLLLAGWAAAWMLMRVAPDARRDFVAYGLVASIVCLLATKPGSADEIRRAGTVALFACTFGLSLLLLYMFWSTQFGPLDLLYRGRFRGWSQNPNQVAIAICPVPFLSCHGFWRSRGTVAQCAYAVALLGSTLVGVASGSDGLVLAWLAGAVILLLHAWLIGIRNGNAATRRGMAIYLFAPLLGLSLLVADGRVPLRIKSKVERIYSEESSGPERLDLWTNALEATTASPLVGLGPGSHSSPSIHTWGNPDGPMEAHNIVVDWGSATGILGVLLLLGLLLSVAKRAAGEPPLMAALAAMFVLGMAQFYLRHPLVWLYLLFIAEIAQGGAAPIEQESPRVAFPLEAARL